MNRYDEAVNKVICTELFVRADTLTPVPVVSKFPGGVNLMRAA